MVRLMLVLTPALCIIGAVGLSYTLGLKIDFIIEVIILFLNIFIFFAQIQMRI